MRLTATFLALCACQAPSWAADSADLLGIWKLEKDALVGSATMYTTFSEAGACTQVAKARIVGVTHWATARCSWSLAGSVLSLEVTASVTTPDTVGNSIEATLEAVSADSFSYRKDGEIEQWTRVAALPPEYAERLSVEIEAGR